MSGTLEFTEQALVLASDGVVALARRVFESGSVDDLHEAAAVADQSLTLQPRRGLGDPRTMHAVDCEATTKIVCTYRFSSPDSVRCLANSCFTASRSTRHMSPGICTTVCMGVDSAPRITGMPTMPSRPTEPASMLEPSSRIVT